MKGSAKEPEMNFMQVEGVQGKVPFILENGDIEVVINKDSIENSKVTGTYNNEELSSYKAKGMANQKKMIKFQQDNMAKMNDAQQKKDSVVINVLRKEYNKFQEEFMKQSDDYLKTHNKAFISVLIIEGMFNQMAPDVAKIKKLYGGLDKSLKDTKHGKNIKSKLDKMNTPVAAAAGVEVGTMAPEFSAPNPDGKVITLKESLGKITIIDFWASWCQPCRQENPNMVAIYKAFHAKGLNMVSVSLDDEAAKWKAAIAKDQLTWTQVSNLKEMDDPIAKAYSIKLIPSTFIVDATGKVIAKDLRGDALKAKVAELLK